MNKENNNWYNGELNSNYSNVSDNGYANEFENASNDRYEDYYGIRVDYNRGRNNKNYNRRKKRKSSDFKNGILIGASSGVAVMLVIASILMGLFYNSGGIKLNQNGQIIVGNSSNNNSDAGIGSQVEDKLNVLDQALDAFYFDDVDKQKAKDYIYKAYLGAYGDKYTVYYTPEEFKQMMESTSGSFYGIGAVCQMKEGVGIQIMDAYKDAPAYKAGIRNGDIITKVNGDEVKDLEISAAVALIKGEEGTKVNLDVLREDKILNFEVERAKVSAKTVEYEMFADNIGYISVSQFDEVTTQQFKTAIDDLNKQGMKGLIIDLRDNPGGVLSTVLDMLEYILPDGLLLYTEEKSGKRTDYKGNDNNELSIPYAVIVNENSASASEVFSGAVQDYGKGKIIGKKTFGKGIVQTIRPLSDGSAIKYTIAKYFTPNGQDIHGQGVKPDIEAELVLPEGVNSVESASDGDTQYQAALKYIKEQIK